MLLLLSFSFPLQQPSLQKQTNKQTETCSLKCSFCNKLAVSSATGAEVNIFFFPLKERVLDRQVSPQRFIVWRWDWGEVEVVVDGERLWGRW